MPDELKTERRPPNPREEDIMAGDRRISRPDASLPDWEVPDTSYRPIPIVWFAGAFLLQMVVLFVIFVVLAGQPGVLTIVAAGLVTGAIGAWTWERGMKDAGGSWKAATFIVLALQFGLVCLSASPRF
ncbi:hypothetical protein BPTFM16_00829 [Altererythrobacter insulae]|nr:hypothetical protein BPTFM16_00829 [Altererythrobacter insulae]